jgi:SAM-dependent methyltransferase
VKSPTAAKLYDRIGRKYGGNKSVAISDYTELPAMLALAGRVERKDVLDVGCGPGRHARALLDRGARVVGIDVSEEMVAAARENCEGRGRFFRADFTRVEFPRKSFDLVNASLCLMYVSDLRPAFKNFSALLRPGSRLIFSIYHPVRFFQKVPDFDFSRRRKVWIHLAGCDVRVWNYYHPLPHYFAALLGSGFELLNFVEPVLDRRRRGWPADSYRIPRSIIFEARKKK